jgi:transposase
MGWTAPASGTRLSELGVVGDFHHAGDLPMAKIRMIGLDLAKSVFQVHGADAAGRCLVRRRLRRTQLLEFFANLPACLVGMEACPSAHHWAREIQALGHEVRLIPPRYARPYVKTNKNDAADAEAICEALGRPTMRFVPVKSREQQSMVMLHRARELLVRQRTQLVNALRGHLAEFGIVGPQGVNRVKDLLAGLAAADDLQVPGLARQVLAMLVEQIRNTESRIAEIERQVITWAQESDACRRLMTIPGIGPVTATALAAAVPDPGVFTSGRHFAAWLGLVPRQNSTGGRERLGSISKRGDGYLRKLLVHGARALMRWSHRRWPWLSDLLNRRPPNVAAVAIANKTARIAWALMRRGEAYRTPAPAAA